MVLPVVVNLIGIAVVIISAVCVERSLRKPPPSLVCLLKPTKNIEAKDSLFTVIPARDKK